MPSGTPTVSPGRHTLLGRLAGAAEAPRGNQRDLADYIFGPGEHIFIPRLRSGTFRSHPAFEGSVDDRLEEDLIALTGQLPALLSELSALPRTRARRRCLPPRTSCSAATASWPSTGAASELPRRFRPRPAADRARQ
jgi:hypothetical protein